MRTAARYHSLQQSGRRASWLFLTAKARGLKGANVQLSSVPPFTLPPERVAYWAMELAVAENTLLAFEPIKPHGSHD